MKAQPISGAGPVYKPYHPRWYRARVSVYWWLGEWRYLKFILRELSSVFVAVFVIEMLVLLRALAQGPEGYASFEQWLRTPAAVALNIVSLFFVVFHAITWFNLTPHAMPLRARGKRIPAVMIAAPNYVAWVAVSLAVAWLFLR